MLTGLKRVSICLSRSVCLGRSVSVCLSRSRSVSVCLGLGLSRSRPVCLGLSVSVSLSRSVCFGQSVSVGLSRSICLGPLVFCLGLPILVCQCVSRSGRTHGRTRPRCPPACTYVRDVDNAIATGQHSRRRRRVLQSNFQFILIFKNAAKHSISEANTPPS